MDRLLTGLQRQVLEDPQNTELRAYYATSLGRIYPPTLGLCLAEGQDWQGLSSLEQDAVFAHVSSALEPHYRWSGVWQSAAAPNFRVGRYEHKKTGMRLHLIPGGSFQMGSSQGLSDEQPPSRRRIRSFLLGQAPVLNSQWQRLGGRVIHEDPSLPRSGISWYEARVWLTKAGGRLRLPLESEWEYACRGPKSSEQDAYYWGRDYDGRYCWSLENSGGRKHDPRDHFGYENAFGLVEMSGNVWEWCDDLYKDYQSGQPNPEDVPLRLYPLRGGSYKSEAAACASTRRLAANVRHRQVDFGLRVARALPAELWS